MVFANSCVSEVLILKFDILVISLDLVKTIWFYIEGVEVHGKPATIYT